MLELVSQSTNIIMVPVIKPHLIGIFTGLLGLSLKANNSIIIGRTIASMTVGIGPIIKEVNVETIDAWLPNVKVYTSIPAVDDKPNQYIASKNRINFRIL